MNRRRPLAYLRELTVGRPLALAPELLAAYPELGEARWRAGGFPLRVGGWCLGQASVAGITLWRTIYLAQPECASVALLLHELAHVRQFARRRMFPVLYCWESLRRGYARNRFEAEADEFARAAIARTDAAAAREEHSARGRPA